ncbi:hypothetical protein GGX14DRAFT_538736 [Mycena pura]|uniref:PIN domain-containing protein n=1 Tax=Mycena pura TaxID=153505 RepID=A0AAD6YT45_9AGAR|nr:hypothetical protein GGX14DRAFT_538736 [Mycena pura]
MSKALVALFLLISPLKLHQISTRTGLKRLQQLSLLQQFVRDVERAALSVLLVIPGAVLNELDGQKKSERLGWFSRRASQWILEKVKQKRSVRSQADQETCRPSGNWRIRQPREERGNDELILDCCMYFAKFRGRTCLLSADKNLCIEKIRSISPASGYDLASFLFGGDMRAFAGHQANYTGNESFEQDDGMDVDEDERLTIPQAMDLLHVQVIDHFTRLLVALVGRVGVEDPGCSDGGVTSSQHAPKWKTSDKPYQDWNAADCIAYLDSKIRVKRTAPRLEVFLSKPYSPGSRCGREWSYDAWSTALEALRQIGEDWNEPSITEDLDGLARHRQAVFGR